MWFSAIKLAVSAGSKIYANKQKTKIAMSDAQLMHGSEDPQTVYGTIAGAMGHAAMRMELGEEIFKDGPSEEVH